MKDSRNKQPNFFANKSLKKNKRKFETKFQNRCLKKYLLFWELYT